MNKRPEFSFHQDGQVFTVADVLKRYYARLVARGRAPKAMDIADNFDGTHAIAARTYEHANIMRNRLLGFKQRLEDRYTPEGGI